MSASIGFVPKFGETDDEDESSTYVPVDFLSQFGGVYNDPAEDDYWNLDADEQELEDIRWLNDMINENTESLAESADTDGPGHEINLNEKFKYWRSNRITKNGIFETEEDAAYAFGQVANPETNKDQKERGAVIRQVTVYDYSPDGELVGRKAYTYGKIYTGTHSTIFKAAAAALLTPGKVSIVHTHPYCEHINTRKNTILCHDPDSFSRIDTNAKWYQFSKRVGDETVAEWKGVNNMYLSSLSSGELYVYDEAYNAKKPERKVGDGLPQFSIKTLK